MADGPHGVNRHSGLTDASGAAITNPTVCFPAECASAASFDGFGRGNQYWLFDRERRWMLRRYAIGLQEFIRNPFQFLRISCQIIT